MSQMNAGPFAKVKMDICDDDDDDDDGVNIFNHSV